MKKYTDEFLLAELRRFYEENGRNPTANDFENNKEFPSNVTYKNHFGSWNNALIEAGFEIQTIYTDEFLILELKRYYNEYGNVPTKNNFNNKDFPATTTYDRHFGSWNNALELAELKVNKIGKLTGDEFCELCKTNKTSHWYYINNKRICGKCYSKDRNYLYGNLNPNSNVGIGVITEDIVYKVLGDCEKCNTKDDFCSEYDLISEKYYNINVKSSKLQKVKNKNSYCWNFNKHNNSKTPDNYICIGFDKDRIKILKVWIINSNSDLINKRGIKITNSKKGLKRALKYEVNSTPYNEIYQNLDITTLPEFRNLNNNEIEMVI